MNQTITTTMTTKLFGPETNPVAIGATSAIALLVATWFLQLRSRRDPREPPKVTSWIPYIGSGVEMGSGNLLDFLRKYRNKFQEPIFSATIMGTVCHFVVDSRYVGLVYKPSAPLDDYSIQRRFLSRIMGLDGSMTDRTLGNAAIMKVAHKQMHQHMLTRESLAHRMEEVQAELDKVLRSYFESTTTTTGDDGRRPLYKTISEVIFVVSMGALISGHLATKPELVHVFERLERQATLLFAGVPEWMLPDAVKARDELISYAASEEFEKLASNWMKERIRFHEDNDIAKDPTDRSHAGLIWAAVGNSSPTIFWMLYHLLETPSGWEAVQKEVDTIGDAPYSLEQLDKMVLLRSSFVEALRMYHFMWTTRDVTKDWEVTMDGKTYLLKKGTRMMSMAGWLHHDPAVYEDPDQFKYDRFVGDPKYKYEDGTPVSEPTRFWGGGARYCPGRKFAEYEGMVFLATLARNYKMELAPSTSRPRFLLEVAGLCPAVPKDEVYIKVERRTI